MVSGGSASAKAFGLLDKSHTVHENCYYAVVDAHKDGFLCKNVRIDVMWASRV